MSRALISVGGTGQHVALAVTRLVHMGALRRDIKLIAIDPDTETPLPQLLESPGGMSAERHPLGMGRVFAPFDVSRVGKKMFSEMFVDADNPLEQELFESMFDGNAASIPVYKGMFGTPCVGATVFAEGSNGSALQDLLKPTAAQSSVFLCGSVVGGTGAGVIHKLIAEVRRYHDKEMFGVFMLPWFSLPTTGAADAITDAKIQRNTKHGVKYFYEHTIPRLTTSLLLGYPGGRTSEVLRPLTLGAGDMGEHPHYLHLVAARALVDLPQAHTADRGVKSYAMAHDDDRAREGWLLDDTWEADVPLRRLVRAQRLLLNVLTFLSQNASKLLDFYQSGSVMRMAKGRAWGDSLHASITSNTPGEAQQAQFVGEVLRELQQVRREAEFCVEWAETIFPPKMLDLASDPLMDKLREGSQKGADSPVHWPYLADVVWKNRPLMRKPGAVHSAVDVARHHAALILAAAKGE
ncbi:MAG: hypothetical protein IT374_05715 [Polyangiaceae bacterium]|nr:hypothetical protein [Polyangiaceae bacterium]